MGGAGWAWAEGDAGGRLLLTGRGAVGGGGCVPRARRARTFDLFETHAWKHFLWLLDNNGTHGRGVDHFLSSILATGVPAVFNTCGCTCLESLGLVWM
jgi:hypothetical protein